MLRLTPSISLRWCSLVRCDWIWFWTGCIWALLLPVGAWPPGPVPSGDFNCPREQECTGPLDNSTGAVGSSEFSPYWSCGVTADRRAGRPGSDSFAAAPQCLDFILDGLFSGSDFACWCLALGSCTFRGLQLPQGAGVHRPPLTTVMGLLAPRSFPLTGPVG